jgi:hypothetical protein
MGFEATLQWNFSWQSSEPCHAGVDAVQHDLVARSEGPLMTKHLANNFQVEEI